MLSGIFVCADSFIPIKDPKLRNKIWNIDIKRGKKNEFIPIALQPTPAQNASRDMANPRYNASLASMWFEWSKSELVGFFIILIVNPNGFIKKL